MTSISRFHSPRPGSVQPVGGDHWSDRCERVTRVTIKVYPGGRGAVQLRQVASTQPSIPLPLTPEESRQRSLIRAQTNVKDRILALNADRMLTLTYRANMEDRAGSREHLRVFHLQMKKQYPNFKMVACAERQERGALHWHVAVRGWVDVNYCRELWCRIIGEDQAGQFNITRLVRDPRKLFYIAKYIGKDMDDGERPRYGHHYVTSRGLEFYTQKDVLVNFTFAGALSEVRQLLLNDQGVTPSSLHHVRSDGPHYFQRAFLRW